MKRALISLLFLLTAFPAHAADAPSKPSPTETEVRAQAIISLLIQQRDEAMNQVAALAVELAKEKAKPKK